MSRVVRSAFAAATFGLAACSGDSPTGPREPTELTCATSRVQYCASETVALHAQAGTLDASERLATALENPAARQTLEVHLGRLAAALDAKKIQSARTAMTAARAAIVAARAQRDAYPGDIPDLAAIELLLDALAPLLGMV